MTETPKKPKPLTKARWILPILLLPMNALVFVPAILLNPMLTSVFIMFLAIFVFANMLYFPLVEEKNLEKRFGETYRKYCRNVPR